jgi:hypothetical protein
MVQLSAIEYGCIAIFLGSLVSFAATTLCDASQRAFVVVVVVVYFVIDSVRKVLDTPSYHDTCSYNHQWVKSIQSRDSSVGIVLGSGLDDWGSRVRFPAGAGNFSLHHSVQNGSGAQPASYPMDTGGSFPGDKATGA